MIRCTRPLAIVSFVLLAAVWALPAMAGTEFDKTFETGPNAILELDSAVGSIEVSGSGGDRVRVRFSAQKDLESKYDFSFEQEGKVVRVTVKKRGGDWKFWSWGSTGRAKFEIEVPRSTEVNVDTSGGRIEVREIDGRVRADTSGGSIELTAIRGNAHADTSGGSIKASDIDGTVHADTSGGGIYIDRVSGDIHADTSGGRIRITEAGGYVLADTSGGSVGVAFAEGNARGGKIGTSGGSISVEVDPSVSLMIDAATSGGSVRTDLELTVQGKLSRTAVRGRLNDGGELLRLRTSGGSIHIEAL